MRKLNLLFCLLSAMAATAQPTVKPNYSSMLVSSLLKKQNTSTASKTTTSTHERLIAQSTYSNVRTFPAGVVINAWGIADSTSYLYSGDRSSFFDYNNMSYSNDYHPSSDGPWLFSNTAAVTDYNGPYYNVYCDKSYRFIPDPNTATGVFTFLDSTTAMYNATNKLTYRDEFYDNIAYTGLEYTNYFNASGNIELSAMFYQNHIDSSWDFGQSRRFEYDAANKLIADSTGSDGVKFTYTYNSTGDLSQIKRFIFSAGWQEMNRYDISYYTSGKLQKVTTYDVDAAGVLNITDNDSLGWTSPLDYYTFEEYKHYDYSGLAYTYTTNKNVAATQLPDTIYSRGDYWSFGYNAGYRTNFTYDALQNPLLATTYMYDSTTSAYDSLYSVQHYYYETYVPDAIANTAVTAVELSVYPNPTNDYLNVSFKGLPNNTPVQLRIVNMLGQVVNNKQTTTYNNSTQLYVNDLPKGTYALIAEDMDSRKVYRQTITKY